MSPPKYPSLGLTRRFHQIQSRAISRFVPVCLVVALLRLLSTVRLGLCIMLVKHPFAVINVTLDASIQMQHEDAISDIWFVSRWCSDSQEHGHSQAGVAEIMGTD